MNQKEQELKKIENFFKIDAEIKNSLWKLAPTEMDDYDEESRIKYVDKLMKKLEDFQIEFVGICKDWGGDKKAVIEKFSQIKNNLINFNYSFGDIKELYKENFSDMSERLIETVKRTFEGYDLFKPISPKNDIIQSSRTINELLHIFSFSIINNENLMKSMPIISKKANDFQYLITLYGEETDLSKNIFDSFPSDLFVGETDILAMKEKILMMVRYRGHALIMDIDETNTEDIVKYFIHNVCDRKKAEQLPGISKITENGARGIFKAPREETIQRLFELIEKIPVDSEILKEDEIDETEIEAQNFERENIFGVQDARDMVMEKGENGRRISKIDKLQKSMKNAMNFLQNKFRNLFSKNEGEDLYDR